MLLVYIAAAVVDKLRIVLGPVLYSTLITQVEVVGVSCHNYWLIILLLLL